MSSTAYPGQELTVFQDATHWKSYWGNMIRSQVKGKVLEVGAGIGGTTPYLLNAEVRDWVLLEPDSSMATLLQEKARQSNWPVVCRVKQGTLRDLHENGFDTILYIDVLEHIEKDAEEFRDAVSILAPGGRIIILSPAYPSLYSAFDKAIGHYRRYTKRSFLQMAPSGLNLISLKYLDGIGCLLSLGNKWVTKQTTPTARQIQFWDRTLIPLSKITDRLTGFSFGRSILGVWEKTNIHPR